MQLAAMRQVSFHEVDILLGIMMSSAETLREQQRTSKDTSEEEVYRKVSGRMCCV